jgi:7-cyano-7-deazaguanine reductase
MGSAGDTPDRLGDIPPPAAPSAANAEDRHMPTKPSRTLETFPNPKPGRAFEIAMECPEFTCVCPMTGQPDFATIRLRYVPNRTCVELKSLKLYLWSFRNEGTFHEAVTNRICDDLVKAIAPRWIEVVGDFAVRGGIHTVVTARHGRRPVG